MAPLKKILFIPVSSTSGIGEYTRSLIIANELIANKLAENSPTFDIRFILNQHVSYSKTCPFTTYLTNGSATKDDKKVKGFLKEFKPDLVVFDCAGRAGHFKLAKQLGAKVVFLSQHEKKRRRGLGYRRLLNIDTHFVVQPKFAIKPISFFTQLKLKWLDKAEPECIGSVFKISNSTQRDRLLQELHIENNDYIVFNAGSGGHQAAGTLASDIFYETAKVISEKTSVICVVVFGDNYPKTLPNIKQNERLIGLTSLPNDQFIGLLMGAKGVVIGGGDTLLQIVELGIKSVVSAVSKDQPKRIEKCQLLDGVYPSALTVADQTNQIEKMLASPLSDRGSSPRAHSQALTVILNEVKRLMQIN